MPASGDGLAILKWVTSFPGNPARNLPTVTGIVLVSDSGTGEPLGMIDAGAVTALRTGASAAVAARALAPRAATTVGLIGCGLNGTWAGRSLQAEGFGPGVCFDVDHSRAAKLAAELGWKVGDVSEAVSCDIVTTVTPGNEPVISAPDLRPGLHINALGADGPGKAEMTIEAVTSCALFCDEWTQASHGGELTGAVTSGLVDRERVTQLGDVLIGAAPGRPSDSAVTLFDSTGLAIQDLAIVKLVMVAVEKAEVESSPISL
jgi:ornithine cyclodeaminase/alanine dehydrogenase-like protein (mu-crystallin family)